MADFGLSVTYGDTINGTDQGDYVESYGERSQIFGGGGDDTILSGGYLSDVHGGADNDYLNILKSYVRIYGDEGDDILAVDARGVNKNIANVSLTGGEGSDRFFFSPYVSTAEGSDKFKSIFSSTITDFNAADGDSIVLNNIQAARELDPNAVEFVYDDDGNLVEANIYDENVFFLDYYREFDRSWSFRDSSGTIQFNLKDVYDLDQIADGTVSYAYADRLWSRSFRDALKSGDLVALGVRKLYETGYISSEYVGDFRLDVVNKILSNSAISAGLISIIDAFNDTVGGRMLAGDANDNQIFAGDGGNKLWSGSGGEDYLIGGNGDDTFFAGATGDDVHYSHIVECADNDVVVLWNVNPGEFSLSEWTKDELRPESYLDVTANDGSNIRIHCPDGVSTTTVQLGDGSRWQYNHVDKYWQALEADTSEQLPTPLDETPDGLMKFNGIVYVLSEYVGDVRLEDLKDESIASIDASEDATGNRALVGDSRDNLIVAGTIVGSGGDTLDGNGGNDILVGGAGADTFVAGQDGGSSILIAECAANDLVYLHNVNFEDLIALDTYIGDEQKCVYLMTNDETYVEMWSPLEESTTTMKFADGSFLRYNFDENTWQQSDSGDENDNRLEAVDDGAELWGGADADVFYVGWESGDDTIEDCDENDLVVLMDIDFDALTNIRLTTDDRSIDIASDDSHIRIVKSDGARTTTVQLADESKWQYTYSDRSWQFKS